MKPIYKKILILVVLFAALKIFLVLVSKGFIKTEMITGGMAESICILQKGFGVECEAAGNTVVYDNHKLVISFLCSGIDQMLFIAIMLFTFFGFEDKKTIYEIIGVVIGVFVLNYLRLLIFYPTSTILGLKISRRIHNFMYYYGQGVALLLIFSAYVTYKILKGKKKQRKKKR